MGRRLGQKLAESAERERSWNRRQTAAKAVAWMVPLCPIESVAPVLMRSLTWWL